MHTQTHGQAGIHTHLKQEMQNVLFSIEATPTEALVPITQVVIRNV